MEADLDRLGGRQQGLLTTWQLRAAGWTDKRIRHAVDVRVLVPYPRRPGVYRIGGAPVTQWQAWMAAVLSCVDTDVVVANLSGAQAWGFRWLPTPDRIHVLTPPTMRRRQVGLQSHRTLWLPAHDRTRLHFVPITTPERTFVDVCGLFAPGMIGKTGDDLLRRRLVTMPRLVRCFEQAPCSGRRKSLPMRAFLAEHLPGYDPGGSDEELDVRRALVRAGFTPLPVQQFRVRVEGRTYKLDYAWPDVMHALEYLGAGIHGVPSAVHHDSARTRRLNRAGWTVWPITSRTTANEIVAIARHVHGLSVTRPPSGGAQ
jgi:hypothetical protein